MGVSGGECIKVTGSVLRQLEIREKGRKRSCAMSANKFVCANDGFCMRGYRISPFLER